MTDIKLSLKPELLARFAAIAEEKGLSLDDCALQAVQDYIECWDDYRRTLHALDNGEEERLVLRAVNE